MRWVLAALVLVSAGWMVFDGAHALLRGDYVTPRSGPRAGQLGPWSRVAAAAGIPPRSTTMKWIFVAYGAAYLAAAGAFLAGLPGSRPCLAAAAVLGLWYAPFGTLVNLAVLAMLASGTAR